MFDPSVGRWMQEDPILFQAGDANPRRYVHNNPTNFTDPSGLLEEQRPFKIVKGTEAKLDKKEFKFNEGEVKGKGTIMVTKDATIEMLTGPNKGNQFSEWMVISATTDFKMDANWHWVQMGVSRYTLSDKTEEADYSKTDFKNKKPFWRKMGTQFLDSRSPDFEDPNSVYYDKTNTASIVTRNELAILDRPFVGPIDPEKYSKVVMQFEAYLVHGTKFYYRVPWKVTFTHDGTRWKPEYEVLAGAGPIDKSPEWASKPRLPGGFLKYDPEKKEASEPFDYVNPFYTKPKEK